MKIIYWEGCDPKIAEAIRKFEKQWEPYSAFSRRYPIIRLLEKVIDPVISNFVRGLPSLYVGFIIGAVNGFCFSEMTKKLGFDVMNRAQRQMLRQFIMTEDFQSPLDRRFVATIESLIELIFQCAVKRPKRSSSGKGITLNKQRKHGFCEFCGNGTEFSVFIKHASKDEVNDSELVEHQKLQLSHRYCAEHRPKLVNGQWNSRYRQAIRSFTQFNLELTRLSRQCAKRNQLNADTGDRLVDMYFCNFMLDSVLHTADKSELRNIARRMVDSKLSDTKKRMLTLKHLGLNQTEIAEKLTDTQDSPITRQAVSKALASIRKEFLLESSK